MAIRINGGVFNDQVLTGSLKHFSLVGADLSGAVDSNGKPVHNSAADIIATLISTKATISIMNPIFSGMSFALETTRADWTASELQSAIRQLGTIGVDNIAMDNIVVTQVSYNFIGDAMIEVISTPTFNLETARAYLIDVDSVTTLPDYTTLAIGAQVRILKTVNVQNASVKSFGSQVIQTSSGNDTEVIIDSTFEYIFVYNGTNWTLSY